jgi:hypothetical protein
MKHFLWVALALVGCTKKNENPTPAGTTILAWDRTQSERETIRSGTMSDAKTHDFEYTGYPIDDVAVKVKVHLETATVVFTHDDKETIHTTPTKISLVLVDGADFTLHDGKCWGPHFKLGAPGEAPRDLILHCIVKATKPNASVSFSFYAYGNGTMDDGVMKKVKVI